MSVEPWWYECVREALPMVLLISVVYLIVVMRGGDL